MLSNSRLEKKSRPCRPLGETRHFFRTPPNCPSHSAQDRRVPVEAVRGLQSAVRHTTAGACGGLGGYFRVYNGATKVDPWRYEYVQADTWPRTRAIGRFGGVYGLAPAVGVPFGVPWAKSPGMGSALGISNGHASRFLWSLSGAREAAGRPRNPN